MPVHDWTQVGAGIFHDFHQTWIIEIKRTLNAGLLPPGFYALAEQFAGGLGPDVLTLEAPPGAGSAGHEGLHGNPGGVALASAPPKVRFHDRAEADHYAIKASSVIIRHASDHRVVAMAEIVSPGNKNNRHGLRGFVEKAEEVLRAGIHLLVVDLFPPGSMDPQGIHKAVWDRFADNDFILPADKQLTLAAYTGGTVQEAFIEPTAVGSSLMDMPLFLTNATYVPVPLERTYQSAWETVPLFWREQLSK